MDRKELTVIKAKSHIADRSKSKSLELLRVAAYCRVSTDHEEQLESFESQKTHYTNLIKSNKGWVLADIYADEAITGTSVDKRDEFNRLINDCMNGDIDLILTKSISRFSRNTLDTLKYIRILKERSIAVIFEQENINTLESDGELLLTVLSAVAQQYVENLSESVKFGIQAKMKRGEYLGDVPLGYNKNKETGEITINGGEAEVVRYIFKRYLEGAGGTIIGRELENLGYKTKRGNSKWAETTVLGIIKNEKYTGSLLLGKTFTVDPISRRRLENRGEADQFLWDNNHEAIIDIDTFQQAQKLLALKNINRTKVDKFGRREKYSRKYTFSCMLKCGFCDSNLSRRNTNSSTPSAKRVWHCVTSTKKGVDNCPECKRIEEKIIEAAFVKSYQLMCGDNKEVLSEFLNRMEGGLRDTGTGKQLSKVERDIKSLETKGKNLLDIFLDGAIEKAVYIKKKIDIDTKLKELNEERQALKETFIDEKQVRQRLEIFKRTLELNEILTEFDSTVFEAVIDRVIVGAKDEDGNPNPYALTFVYKTGTQDIIDSGKICSYTPNNTR